MADKRPRAPRYRVQGLTAIYDDGESFWTGPVVDASPSGLFIETAHEPPIGAEITLMPVGDERLPFEVRGKVVRVNRPRSPDDRAGIAVELEGLTREQMELLLSTLVARGEKLP